ncbi:hypothetical protein H0H93_004593 [Arthromyces matolae]|nr:hypothetical protein H0H93_004593 [Arthromyces matolae]
MKATLISTITIACLASKLIPDIVRAFPIPPAANDQDIVKPVTRRDESFVDSQTIRALEEHGVPSFPFVLRSIDVPILQDIRARSGGANPIVLPLVPSTFSVALIRDVNLEPEVRDYDNLPQVQDFEMPPPPDDHTVLLSGPEPPHRVDAKRAREKMGGDLKRHLLTLLRNTHHPETLTVAQVKHARMRVMQLWVLVTAADLILLGSQPYPLSLRRLILARQYAIIGVERDATLYRLTNQEEEVARLCLDYYDQVGMAFSHPRPQVASFSPYASNMFNITSPFYGNHHPEPSTSPISTPNTPE